MTLVQEDQSVKLLGATQLHKHKLGNWVVASGSQTRRKKKQISEKLQAGGYCWDTHQTSHTLSRNNGAISATAELIMTATGRAVASYEENISAMGVSLAEDREPALS